VGGVSGSGKSTLARPLAQALGAEVLRSDEVRQELRAGHGTAGGDSAGAVGGGYSELAARAAGMLAPGRSVVLDATWLAPRARAGAEEVAADAHAELVGRACTALRGERARRITERARTAADPSEATVEVLAAQLAELAPWPDAIEVDTTALDVRDADAVVTWAA